MYLTKQQKDVLIGTLLGDGCLELNGTKVRLRIDHSDKQREYVEWKHKIFANIAANKPRAVNVLDRRTKKIYNHCCFDTLSKTLFAEYRQLFYKSGDKIVPPNIEKFLKNRLSLAVWFMDDGYKRRDCRGLHVNTQSYCLEEQRILQNCLKKNFKIDTSIHRQSGKYKLYVPAKGSKRFCNLIAQHIVPSMRYKLL